MPATRLGGTIAIVGADDDGISASLTADQLGAVAKAHRFGPRGFLIATSMAPRGARA
jgi:hypothetical protein